MITKKDIYGWNTSYRPNTFIGGVGTTISTKSLLAAKLGISTTRIKSFRIVNDEVQACIEGNYSIGASVWSNNNELTHYHDIDGLITGTALNAIRNCTNLVSINFPKCTILGLGCFYNCVKLTTVLLPELIEVGTSSLQNCSQLTMLDLPKVTYVGPFGLSNNPLLAYVNLPSVTNLGGSVLNNSVFTSVKNGCVVNVPYAMASINSGLPDGDLSITLLDVNYVDYNHNPTSFNTEIGGVASTLNTRRLIGNQLGVTSARILDFSIIGTDIRFRIIGKYTMANNAFLDNANITYFKDNGLLCKTLAIGCFYNCINLSALEMYGLEDLGGGGSSSNQAKIYNTKLTTLYFPELKTVNGTYSITGNPLLTSFDAPIATSAPNNSVLRNNPELAYINIPSVIGNIGSLPGLNNMFDNVKAGCIVNVNMSMMTNNSGLPDGDLQSALLDVNYVDYTNVSSNFNTEVGGVASTINTRRLIGNLLGVTSSRIVDFSIVNSDIKFRVLGTYTLPSRIFENNSLISKYLDHDGLVTAASTRVFYNATNLTSVFFPSLISAAEGTFAFTGLQTITLPSLTEIGNQMFNGCPYLKSVSLPILVNCTGTSHFLNNTNLEEVHLPMIDKLGNSVVANSIFSGVKSGCKVYVPQSMMTINSGMPDGDLTNILLNVVYIGYVDNYDNYNTEIGGISAIYDTRFKIGVKLGIGSARIVDFSIVGSDIRFRVIGQYTIGTDAFRDNLSITFFKTTIPTNFGKNCFMDSSVTSLISPLLTDIIDTALYSTKCSTYEFPLCSVIGASGFTRCTEVEHLNFPELLSIRMWQTFDGATKLKTFKADKLHTMTDGASRQFDGTINFELFDAKKLKTLPSTFAPTGNNVFKGWKSGAKMMVNVYLATSNSGGPSPHIQWAKDSRNAIVEFYDDDGNYVSTL